MIKNIRNVSNILGIDGAIAYTVLSRFVQAGGGILTIIFIAKCLNKVEQGYYYTFVSILAIQIFFELGLSNIITQFVAHENVSLTWRNGTIFTGSEESSSRLASLLKFTVKWFGVIAVLLFFGLLISGYLFFGVFGKNGVNWQIPWIIMSTTTSLSLISSPILAFFEGLGKIKEVARIRLIQQMVQLSLVLFFFSLGLKLFSSPLAALVSFAILPIWILSGRRRKLLQLIWSKIGKWQVNYRLEIFPYQWKIALSWISGYFIFQLFNPVIFATEGAIVAGQMGMTLAVLNSILVVSLSWVTTKVPLFSGLIAKKEFGQLDRLFKLTIKQSTGLNIFALTTFLIFIYIINHLELKVSGRNFGERFLPILPMLFMMIPVVINHIISCWATYLRCHKNEPFLLYSVVTGFVCTLSTLILGKYFGVNGMAIGYTIISFIGLVWTNIIFNNKRKQWHSKDGK